MMATNTVRGEWKRYARFEEDLAERLAPAMGHREFCLLPALGKVALFQIRGTQGEPAAYLDADDAEFALRGFTRLEIKAVLFSKGVMA